MAPKCLSSSQISLLSSRLYIQLTVGHAHFLDHRKFRHTTSKLTLTSPHHMCFPFSNFVYIAPFYQAWISGGWKTNCLFSTDTTILLNIIPSFFAFAIFFGGVNSQVYIIIDLYLLIWMVMCHFGSSNLHIWSPTSSHTHLDSLIWEMGNDTHFSVDPNNSLWFSKAIQGWLWLFNNLHVIYY